MKIVKFRGYPVILYEVVVKQSKTKQEKNKLDFLVDCFIH